MITGESHHGIGLTPAFAGNTPTPTKRASARRAHPRVRGEYVLNKVDGHVVARLTPAFAGNT